MRCSFCGSLFEILRNEPQLRINKGAHVTFGERANVEIRGDMEIEAWADVDIRGKVTLVKGKERREFTLKLVQGKKHSD